jgi:glycosyltransferase involved in cell wall biosynthesis
MVIAINAGFLSKSVQNDTDVFLLNTLLQVAGDHPDYRFLFISDSPFVVPVSFPANITPVIAGPVCKNNLTQYWWQRFTLPRLLKKHKATSYCSTNGIASLYTEVPQCLLVTDIGYLTYLEVYTTKQDKYLRKRVPFFLKKARNIITLSESEREVLQEQAGSKSLPVTVITPAIDRAFIPLTYEQKKQVKETYTGGCEYFFYSGSLHTSNNLLHVLKAFSKFKKRQQSNWKLVIAAITATDSTFVNRLQTYKHKEDVILLPDIGREELPRLTAAAYAFVAPALYEGAGIHLLQAMQCRVPVISSTRCYLYALAPDAALYADPERIDDIAQQLMLLYKDEPLCKKLSEKAGLFVSRYNNPSAATAFWQTIVS